MSGLTRDGTAEPNSRDQTLRRERGQGKFVSPVQLTDHKQQEWQPYLVDAQSAESDDHLYTHAEILAAAKSDVIGCEKTR